MELCNNGGVLILVVVIGWRKEEGYLYPSKILPVGEAEEPDIPAKVRTGYSGSWIFRCPVEITGAKYPVTTSISEFWSLTAFTSDRIFRCLEISGIKYPVTISTSEFWSLVEFHLRPDIPVPGNIR